MERSKNYTAHFARLYPDPRQLSPSKEKLYLHRAELRTASIHVPTERSNLGLEKQCASLEPQTLFTLNSPGECQLLVE
ncbi:unnamed protein product, partial [Mesorhabditis spiculigera]